MFPDLTFLPEWLLVGLLVGGLGSVGVAALFVVASRRYPSSVEPTDVGVDGDGRRRAELRAYLDAIEEPYAEDHPVAGQPVAFYLPERDVVVTYDARAYYRIEHTETDPVLVEHEMPGVHLGARLPFEVPEVDSGERTSAGDLDPAAAAFRELGLTPPATLSDVKAAYRERVKDTHPDLGGDEEEFRRVREAYTTAKQYTAEERTAERSAP